ncbi:hypothetical protein Tco_1362693 [Tanacetum coccineum]
MACDADCDVSGGRDRNGSGFSVVDNVAAARCSLKPGSRCNRKGDLASCAKKSVGTGLSRVEDPTSRLKRIRGVTETQIKRVGRNADVVSRSAGGGMERGWGYNTGRSGDVFLQNRQQLFLAGLRLFPRDGSRICCVVKCVHWKGSGIGESFGGVGGAILGYVVGVWWGGGLFRGNWRRADGAGGAGQDLDDVRVIGWGKVDGGVEALGVYRGAEGAFGSFGGGVGFWWFIVGRKQGPVANRVVLTDMGLNRRLRGRGGGLDGVWWAARCNTDRLLPGVLLKISFPTKQRLAKLLKGLQITTNTIMKLLEFERTTRLILRAIVKLQREKTIG